MNKKIFIYSIVALIFILVIVFCINSSKNYDNNKIKIVTSFYPMYIATENLVMGIDEIELSNLTANNTGCVHDYTLTTQEMVKLSGAKIVVINGSGMEHFLEDVINNYDNLCIIDTSNGVSTINTKHEINPHTFASIDNYIIQVKNICEGLSKKLPEYKNIFEKNTEKYIIELEKVKQYGMEKLQNFNNEKIVVINEAFEYFAKDFNLNIVYTVHEKEQSAVSATEIINIINMIKEQDVKIIVTTKDEVSNAAMSISRETDIEVVEFNPIVTGQNDFDAYTKEYMKNIDILFNALNGGV